MDNLDELRRMAIFVQVVEAESFTGAARLLGMTKSGVSRHVTLLEEHVGAPLLARTTRRLSLTEIGEAFYDRCVRMVAEADAAMAEVKGRTEKATGTLRVAGPQHLGQTRLAPALVDFRARHPELELELVLEDAYTDLVTEQIDVAVRVGKLAPSSLIARKLATVEVSICGSPDYLARRGTPTSPDQLADHDWVLYTLGRAPNRLSLRGPDGARHTVRIDGALRTNSGAATHELVRRGAGLAPLPLFYVDDDLAAGRLTTVSCGYTIDPIAIHAVFVPGRDLLPKVRLFVDFLVDLFGGRS
jgi:DNA-binding transcriptional LysR family regulator